MIAERSNTVSTMVGPVSGVIQQYADQMERERQMPPELHEAFRRAGLFGIYLPKALGGRGLTLPEGLRVVEAVAAVDGSAGWTAALSVAAAYFTGCVRPEVAAEILGDGDVLVAGGGKLLRAEAVDGGYLVSGQLPYCSGAVHAGWFSGIAQLHDGDVPRIGPEGPEMIGWFIPRAGGRVIDTWNVTGLCGTGTHDVVFENQFVPGEYAFSGSAVAGFAMHRGDPLLRLPFMTLISTVQAPPVCLGVARHALDAFREIATAKMNPLNGQALRDRPAVQARLAKAESMVRAARAQYFEAVQHAWDTVADGEELSVNDKASVRLASTLVAEHCTEAVDAVFRMAGASAITAKSPLERCWRDIHTAAAHIQVQDSNWESAGRVLLGLEPGTFVF